MTNLDEHDCTQENPDRRYTNGAIYGPCESELCGGGGCCPACGCRIHWCLCGCVYYYDCDCACHTKGDDNE